MKVFKDKNLTNTSQRGEIMKSNAKLATVVSLSLLAALSVNAGDSKVNVSSLNRGIQNTQHLSSAANQSSQNSGRIMVKIRGKSNLEEFYTKLLDKTKSSQQNLVSLKKFKLSESKKISINKSNTAKDETYINVIQSSKLSTAQLIEAAEKLDGVIYAEKDYRININQAPNDPSFDELWGLNNPNLPESDVNALDAWSITTGSSDVVVGVIDSGVNYNHSDLAQNMWKNEAELNGTPGIDDDNNGYIDDIYGIDTENGDTDPMDDNGHGSHCSGTIGAQGDNNQGVVGVNWNVKIAGCKFLDMDGYGWISGATECVNYFNSLKESGVNMVATNNSWGGGSYNNSMYEAIENANALDIAFIAAAGNDGTNNDVTPHYPSNYDLSNVVSVAASDRYDNLASFNYGGSNFGINTVDIVAPGKDILSTVLGNNYSSYSGTSMATPHVTGAIALLASVDEGLTVSDRIQKIFSTVSLKTNYTNKCVTGGLLDLSAMLDGLGGGDPDPVESTNPTDFDGDGVSDILWRHTRSGQFLNTYMNADGSVKNEVSGATISNSWKIEATGNFDGDDLAGDILWRNNRGNYIVYFMNADGSTKGYSDIHYKGTEWAVQPQ